jgi:hypothetical protein
MTTSGSDRQGARRSVLELAAHRSSLPHTATLQELFNSCAAHGSKAWDHSALVCALEIRSTFEIGAPVP